MIGGEADERALSDPLGEQLVQQATNQPIEVLHLGCVVTPVTVRRLRLASRDAHLGRAGTSVDRRREAPMVNGVVLHWGDEEGWVRPGKGDVEEKGRVGRPAPQQLKSLVVHVIVLVQVVRKHALRALVSFHAGTVRVPSAHRGAVLEQHGLTREPVAIALVRLRLVNHILLTLHANAIAEAQLTLVVHARPVGAELRAKLCSLVEIVLAGRRRPVPRALEALIKCGYGKWKVIVLIGRHTRLVIFTA